MLAMPKGLTKSLWPGVSRVRTSTGLAKTSTAGLSAVRSVAGRPRALNFRNVRRSGDLPCGLACALGPIFFCWMKRETCAQRTCACISLSHNTRYARNKIPAFFFSFKFLGHSPKPVCLLRYVMTRHTRIHVVVPRAHRTHWFLVTAISR